MAYTLYFHPLASFCHKVLIALYERGVPFEPHFVDLADAGARNSLLALWPVGKIPVLHDPVRDRAVAETSIIIEYLDRHHAAGPPMIPADPEAALEVRLWDRFHDLYVSVPMQTIVLDRLRPADGRDPIGVASARATLETAYDMLERELARHAWAATDTFSMADCSAAPALFYAEKVQPFTPRFPTLAAYYARLLQRPSVARTIEEAMPYMGNVPSDPDAAT